MNKELVDALEALALAIFRVFVFMSMCLVTHQLNGIIDFLKVIAERMK